MFIYPLQHGFFTAFTPLGDLRFAMEVEVMNYPKNADHFLITEAWRRVEQFQSEVDREQVLALYRKSQSVPWRYSVARFLIWLALQFDSGLGQGLQPLDETRAHCR